MKNREQRSHKLWPVSKRGRAAYLILCLEEVLKYYNQNFDTWRWILEELWAITTIDAMYEGDWVGRVCDLLPEEILTCKTYQIIVASRKQSQAAIWYGHTEIIFNHLYDLYNNPELDIKVICAVMDNIYFVISDEWGDMETPHTPDALQYIDDTEKILKENQIPLPQDKNSLVFLLNHKNKHLGKPFDGIHFSALASWPKSEENLQHVFEYGQPYM